MNATFETRLEVGCVTCPKRRQHTSRRAATVLLAGIDTSGTPLKVKETVTVETAVEVTAGLNTTELSHTSVVVNQFSDEKGGCSGEPCPFDDAVSKANGEIEQRIINLLTTRI